MIKTFVTHVNWNDRLFKDLSLHVFFQLQINALSKFLEVPIEVIQADVPSIISGEEFKTPHIMLTYVNMIISNDINSAF